MKPVLSRHSKIDKIYVLKKSGCLVHGESIAKCSRAFCNTFNLHYASILENMFGLLFDWPFKTGFTASIGSVISLNVKY